jgi:glutamate/tyrosine decarboxylase-like PLP-dependent enzyme
VGAMSAHGAYLPEHGAEWDAADCVPELSRRARGVPSYAILRTLGRDGMRAMVARHCGLAATVGQALRQVEGITVMSEAASNQVAFRCGDGEAGDAATDAVLARVQAMGRVYPSHGVWRGRHIIRVSVCAYGTGEDEVAMLVADVRAAWGEVRGDGHGA